MERSASDQAEDDASDAPPGGGAATRDHDLPAEVLKELLAYASDSIMVTDASYCVAYASPSVERIMGWLPEQVVGRNAEEFIHPDDLEGLYTEAANQILLGTEARPILFRQRCADGSFRHVEARVSALPDGHPLGVAIINARDVSDRVAAEQARAASEAAHHESQGVIQMVAEGRPFDEIVDAVAALVERRAPGCFAAISQVDEKHQVLRAVGTARVPEPLAPKLRERPLVEGMGSCVTAVRQRRSVYTDHADRDPAWDVLAEEADASGLRACWSTPIRAAKANTILGTLALYWPDASLPSPEHLEVMSEAARLASIALGRQRFESELAHRATHDALTGLPNRSLLYDRMDQALARQRRSRSDEVAVMFVDLDHFKDVNDKLGHRAGDELLRQAAGRLRSTIREVDTIARFGGDEFIVLAHTSDLTTLACRLNEAMTADFPIGEGVSISCSIGIATYRDGDTPDTLIHRADLALYHAKEHGRNCFAQYENSPAQGIAMIDFDAVAPRPRSAPTR